MREGRRADRVGRRRPVGRSRSRPPLLLALLLLALLAGGCAPGWGGGNAGGEGREGAAPPSVAQGEGPSVLFRLSRDYGAVTLDARPLPYRPGASVLDLLREHYAVDLAYGGGFVAGIDGLRSGYTGRRAGKREPADWFYYVNGVAAGVGAGAYEPRPGDRIWWDYHRWDGGPELRAAVGAFPAPFRGGYGGVGGGARLVHDEEGAVVARRLARLLREEGVTDVSLEPIEGVGSVWEGERPVWVIATRRTALAHPVLRPLSEAAATLGLAAAWDAEGFHPTARPGTAPEEARRPWPWRGTALLAAAAGPPGGPVAVWLLLGGGAADLDRVASLLERAPEHLAGRFAWLVTAERRAPLPVVPPAAVPTPPPGGRPDGAGG